MYAAVDYYSGEGFQTDWVHNYLHFIWHKTGIDAGAPANQCGDGFTGLDGDGEWTDNICIFDPDPYDNNVWWTEEHGWICEDNPSYDSTCSGSGACGPGNSYNCIETTPMYTYQAVEVESWTQWGFGNIGEGSHGGVQELPDSGRCDNALTPILYTLNEAQGNATIEITEGDLPFTFPTDQETHVPYFMADVGGISKNLEFIYHCEDFGGDYLTNPYDFIITYRVVECMYFTTNGGTVHHWGYPYCAESNELDWECNDANPLKCSPYSEMWIRPSVFGSRADFGADGGGRGPIQFHDESEVASGEEIVTWAWDFGDGNGSDQPNPTHTYGDMGTYTVQLTIGIDTGEEKITQRDVWVGSISHDADWNLVSVPVEAHDMWHMALFPDAIQNTLYGWGVGYQSADDLEVGKGYWLRFTSAGENIVAGLVPSIGGWEGAGIELESGWNFIGGLTKTWNFSPDHVSDPDLIIVPGTLYGFDNGYIQSSELSPEKAIGSEQTVPA
jgi:hypothetical protein